MKGGMSLSRQLQAILGAAVLVVLAGCGAATHKPSASEKPSSKATATASASASATPSGPLPAPAMVQVDNISLARPQSGLSNANIVYEYNTEGGITRFTAIYFQMPSGAVGDIRSARLVSLALEQEYKGVLLYSGSSMYVTAHLAAANIPRYEEDSAQGLMYRTNNASPPYNLFIDGKNMQSLLKESNLPAVTYQLWSRSTTATPGGVAATTFTVPLSPSTQPTYTWNVADDAYIKSYSDTGVFTTPDGKPLPMATVVVMQIRVTALDYIEDVNNQHGLYYQLTGSGPAQVFTGGEEYSGTWSMNGNGPPKFTQTNGGSIPVAPGTVWMDLVPTGQPATLG